MSFSDDEAHALGKGSGKQKIGEVEPELAITGSSSSKLLVTVDSFGAVNVLTPDKFGALREPEGERPNACFDVQNKVESSTRSSNPFEHYARGSKYSQACPEATGSTNDSTWTKYMEVFEDKGTGVLSSKETGAQNPGLQSSTPIFSTLHERTSTRSGGGPRVRRFCSPTEYGSSHSSLPNEQISLEVLPRFPLMVPGSSGDARHSRESTDQYPRRIEYKFASASLEASLLQYMEERERKQINEAYEENRMRGYVTSPEDLIWGSVKHYCGIVLDRETRTLLGTAVLFVPPDPSMSGCSTFFKSAWVTCVKVVEGRTEVLIKTSKGGIHVAQLMLTSTTLGLALFSVHVWQGTFALAFLSRVTGPASLPHRLFVDVARNDRVYVIGYEEPLGSETGLLADVRVRSGRVIDAGRHAIVEIDFETGRLGGSINIAAGFRGGLVVRADGLLAGLVTGEILGGHPTNIDFSYAINIYSLLAEL
uniref:Uncharacterized protein n=1 Tax=Physcomitrium patens TaxID=3218 RepID=A0A7I4BKE9_PHYPA